MSHTVLVDAVRTPHGAFLGSLSSVSAVQLGSTAVGGLLDRIDVGPGAIDWVGLGNAIQAAVGQVPARQAAMEGGVQESVPATTINEASGSGLRAIALAVDRIEAGRADFAIAGGMESMSRAPHALQGYREGRRHGDATLLDLMLTDGLVDQLYDAHMGELTERLADRFDLTREAQDAYAVDSHRRAATAIDSGAFDAEIVPVETDDGSLERDEGPRPEADVETLSGLPPAFETDGTITAGNASDLSDGAGVALLADAEAARKEGLDPLVRVVDYAVAYRDPKWFGMSVGDAVEDLLEANDLEVGDVDTFELNEAFAAQMVYVRDRLDLPPSRHNPQGGAVSLGHPIGASGGILTTTLAHRMKHEDFDRGIVGMSVAGGGGIAMLLER
jgi:acetyl-CoA C-acetyltransferase